MNHLSSKHIKISVGFADFDSIQHVHSKYNLESDFAGFLLRDSVIIGWKSYIDGKLVFNFNEDSNLVSIVRENLLSVPGYSPYCGSNSCSLNFSRSTFNIELGQFVCSTCNWVSDFPPDFISAYKQKWDL